VAGRGPPVKYPPIPSDFPAAGPRAPFRAIATAEGAGGTDFARNGMAVAGSGLPIRYHGIRSGGGRISPAVATGETA